MQRLRPLEKPLEIEQTVKEYLTQSREARAKEAEAFYNKIDSQGLGVVLEKAVLKGNIYDRAKDFAGFKDKDIIITQGRNQRNYKFLDRLSTEDLYEEHVCARDAVILAHKEGDPRLPNLLFYQLEISIIYNERFSFSNIAERVAIENPGPDDFLQPKNRNLDDTVARLGIDAEAIEENLASKGKSKYLKL
jgi:hypothetical protein